MKRGLAFNQAQGNTARCRRGLERDRGWERQEWAEGLALEPGPLGLKSGFAPHF